MTYAPKQPGDRDDATFATQLAVCTRSEDCDAAPSQHEPDCPVEQKLKAEFGF